jgi:hypothetical protein
MRFSVVVSFWVGDPALPARMIVKTRKNLGINASYGNK